MLCESCDERWEMGWLSNQRPVEDLSCVMMEIFHVWRISFLCDDGRILWQLYHEPSLWPGDWLRLIRALVCQTLWVLNDIWYELLCHEFVRIVLCALLYVFVNNVFQSLCHVLTSRVWSIIIIIIKCYLFTHTSFVNLTGCICLPPGAPFYWCRGDLQVWISRRETQFER